MQPCMSKLLCHSLHLSFLVHLYNSLPLASMSDATELMLILQLLLAMLFLPIYSTMRWIWVSWVFAGLKESQWQYALSFTFTASILQAISSSSMTSTSFQEKQRLTYGLRLRIALRYLVKVFGNHGECTFLHLCRVTLEQISLQLKQLHEMLRFYSKYLQLVSRCPVLFQSAIVLAKDLKDLLKPIIEFHFSLSFSSIY